MRLNFKEYNIEREKEKLEKLSEMTTTVYAKDWVECAECSHYIKDEEVWSCGSSHPLMDYIEIFYICKECSSSKEHALHILRDVVDTPTKIHAGITK